MYVRMCVLHELASSLVGVVMMAASSSHRDASLHAPRSVAYYSHSRRVGERVYGNTLRVGRVGQSWADIANLPRE
jgi:hypothetical protein